MAMAAAVGGWLAAYWAGQRPSLVLRLPKEKCQSLSFGLAGSARGPEVDKLCRENGVSQGPVFALRGKTAVRFVPYVFHGVHGRLEMAGADADTVYFYRYDERYQPIVWEP